MAPFRSEVEVKKIWSDFECEKTPMNLISGSKYALFSRNEISKIASDWKASVWDPSSGGWDLSIELWLRNFRDHWMGSSVVTKIDKSFLFGKRLPRRPWSLTGAFESEPIKSSRAWMLTIGIILEVYGGLKSGVTRWHISGLILKSKKFLRIQNAKRLPHKKNFSFPSYLVWFGRN